MVERTQRRRFLQLPGRPRRRRLNVLSVGASLVAALLFVPAVPSAQAATLSVNCNTGGDLQAKIDAAASGSTILVKGTCLGSFLITGKALTLKGNPTATLDGNDLGSVLGINASGRAIHLSALTITGGADGQAGAGIFSSAASLTMNNVSVTGNLVAGGSFPAQGAGIFSQSGNLTLTNSKVTANRALATGGANLAEGGGLFFQNGNLTIKGSVISGNRATAHPDSGASHAFGGGFYLTGAHLVVQGSTIAGNRLTAFSDGDAEARGAAGEQASGSTASISGSTVTKNAGTAHSDTGSAGGGQTLLLNGTSASVTNSTLAANTATTDAPGQGAAVFAGGIYGTTLEITSSKVSGNSVRSTGDSQATASDGGAYASDLKVTRSTVDGNAVTAEASAGTASAEGGGIGGTNITLDSSTVSHNVLTAKARGANDANATGGGIYQGDPQISNSTIALNHVIAASPDPGGGSHADGGGLYVPFSTSSLVDTTVAGNTSTASGASPVAEAGGLDAVNSLVKLEATIVANNVATVGPDCVGDPGSEGHNLVRKLAGCTFVKKPTDKVGVDPKLGPLQANGGPTQTMAIALTSPALNAILPAACAVAKDQRGVHRPQGPKCDIGAYERKLT